MIQQWLKIAGILAIFLPAVLLGIYVYFKFGKEPEVPQAPDYLFEPPGDDAPALVQALIAEKSSDISGDITDEFTATLFDLIRRGFIDATATTTPQDSLGGARMKDVGDIAMAVTDKGKAALSGNELILLGSVAAGKTTPMGQLMRDISPSGSTRAENSSPDDLEPFERSVLATIDHAQKDEELVLLTEMEDIIERDNTYFFYGRFNEFKTYFSSISYKWWVRGGFKRLFVPWLLGVFVAFIGAIVAGSLGASAAIRSRWNRSVGALVPLVVRPHRRRQHGHPHLPAVQTPQLGAEDRPGRTRRVEVEGVPPLPQRLRRDEGSGARLDRDLGAVPLLRHRFRDLGEGAGGRRAERLPRD